MDTMNNVMSDVNVTDEGASARTFTGMVPEWSKLTLSVLLVIVFTVGVPGNVVVVTTMLKLKLRTSTDWLIMFISMSDLLSLLISCPVYLMLFNSSIWSQVGSSSLCSFHHYVLHVVFLSSCLFIMAIGIDRYLKTCRPHQQTFTPKHAAITCITITCASLITCLPFAFGSSNNYSQCVYGDSKIRMITYIFLLFVVITVSVVLVYLYARICFVLRGRIRTRPGNTAGLGTSVKSINVVQFDKSQERVHFKHVAAFHAKPRNCSLKQAAVTRFSLKSDDVLELCKAKKSTVSTVTCVSGLTINNVESVVESGLNQNYPNPEIDQPSTSVNQPTGNTSIRHVTASAHECSLYRTSGFAMAKKVEKTTRLVALITGIFALCTIVPVISVVFLITSDTNQGLSGKIAVFFLLRMYLINNAINPVFFSLLSSKFRKKARETFNCF